MSGNRSSAATRASSAVRSRSTKSRTPSSAWRLRASRYPIRPDRCRSGRRSLATHRRPTLQPITEQRGARLLDAVARLPRRRRRSNGRMQKSTPWRRGWPRSIPDSHKNVPATFVAPELERLLGRRVTPILILWGAVALVLLSRARTSRTCCSLGPPIGIMSSASGWRSADRACGSCGSS